MWAQKWNETFKQYEPYEVPDDWNTPLLSSDMHQVVNCAECGTHLEFGNCFTSQLIHNKYGLGYPVCPKCYAEEFRIRCT